MIYKIYCTKCSDVEMIENKKHVEEIVKNHTHQCNHCNTKFRYIAIQCEGELKLKGIIDA